MNLQENINRHLANLPESLHAEVLDFVLFLEYKQSRTRKTIPQETPSLAEFLTTIPNVGRDEDFERIDKAESPNDDVPRP